MDASLGRAIFDAEVLAGLQRFLPPERLRVYLQDLDRQLLLMIDLPVSEPSLQDKAHKLVSQAGMLGLTRISECARTLENACRSGTGEQAALRDCRMAVGDVRRYALPAAAALAPGVQRHDSGADGLNEGSRE